MTATDPTADTDLAFLRAFVASGDVGHLLPLADHAEETDRHQLAYRARRVIQFARALAEPVRFFLEHGNALNGPANWFAGALHYAEVELWFADLEAEGRAQVRWVDDPDADRSWMDEADDHDAPAYGCIVELLDDGEPTGEGESCWGTFLATYPTGPGRDPYARVLEAELKSELHRSYPTANE